MFLLHIKHPLTLLNQLLIEPFAPDFKNEATTTTVTASFATVLEEKGQLMYQMQAKDTAGIIKSGQCVIATRKCTVGGLTPGRKYLLSVKACISEDTSICGAFSTETTSYTIPQSRYLVIVTEPRTSKIYHVFICRTVAASHRWLQRSD